MQGGNNLESPNQLEEARGASVYVEKTDNSLLELKELNFLLL